MGCMLSCFGRNHWQEPVPLPRSAQIDYTHVSAHVRSFMRLIIDQRNRRFEGRVHAVHSAAVETSHSAATVVDNSIPRTFCSHPRPLPYDDPIFSQRHEELEISQIEPLSHSNEQTVALQLSNRKTKKELQKKKNLLIGVNCEGANKESSAGHSSADATSELTCYDSSSEDEDICPICLEGYTSENPKETLQCSHVFHLCCVYEWMERSEACPICSKVMLFRETK